MAKSCTALAKRPIASDYPVFRFQRRSQCAGRRSYRQPTWHGHRFHLPSGASTDLIAQSYKGFPARTPEEFLSFLRALASSGAAAPTPTALDNFLATHPQAKLFAMAPKPIPTSFATESFYAVDAFRFTNREGASRYGRYRIIPDGGTKHLDAVEAARRPANFLFEELADRLSRGPIKFYIAVQLAEPDRGPFTSLAG